MIQLNKSLMFMLIFTIISSLLAYIIIVKSYDSFLQFDNNYYFN